jgi:membrane fusion protein (multidrug efflux system)
MLKPLWKKFKMATKHISQYQWGCFFMISVLANSVMAQNTLHPSPKIFLISQNALPQTPQAFFPEKLPTQLPNKSSTTQMIAASSIDEFPAELPNSITQTSDQPEHLNTPEYVIIRSSDQATFSSETTAHIALLTIEEGSYFKQGDILLQLDCREQQAELKKSQAQQQATREAEKSANRLQSYGSISESELIKAQSEAAMADADVERLKAVVDKCTIRAPFNGAVSELMVHAHETVKPGDPLLKIVNTDKLELQMQIPSSWLQWMRIGTEFNVHVSEINESINAKVIKINPQIDSVSQTVKIIGIITEHNPNLLPGMSGQAIFPDNPDLKTIKSKN